MVAHKIYAMKTISFFIVSMSHHHNSEFDRSYSQAIHEMKQKS